ncbi:hypothetical protein, partial [Segatella paludivivens]
CLLFKDTASRTNYPIQMRFFIFIVEAPRILFKDTTSRTDYLIQMQFFRRSESHHSNHLLPKKNKIPVYALTI